MQLLVMIGVLLHFFAYVPFATAEQINHINSLSEQFVRTVSKAKGSNSLEGRVLQLQKVETSIRRIKEKSQQAQRLTRTKQQRTMQNRNSAFRLQRRFRKQGVWNGGGGDGDWFNPRGWIGGGGGGHWWGGKSEKSTSQQWEAPPYGGSFWGQRWGGSGNKPAYSPTKPAEKTFYPTYYVSPEPKPKPAPPKPKPTKPSPKPSQQMDTYQPTDLGDMRLIQITMDGMLTVINLNVPAEGTQAMETLANVFERTISSFLGEPYKVNVYEIGGIPVNNIQNGAGEDDDKTSTDDNALNDDDASDDDNISVDDIKKRKQRKGSHRNLQGWEEWDTRLWEKNDEASWALDLKTCVAADDQIPVLFEVTVIIPCFNCDEEKALAKGVEIYSETFAVLDDAVKSGEMSSAFCAIAVLSGVVTYPCEVIITCVMGTSLKVRFVDEIMDTSKPTPSLTPGLTDNPTSDSSEPTSNPTRNPTLFPTRNPTLAPTGGGPTQVPTGEGNEPTQVPTDGNEPTQVPTGGNEPTQVPTGANEPTLIPTPSPTGEGNEPTIIPTPSPTGEGNEPTIIPTQSPTGKGEEPTLSPTLSPAGEMPTFQPTFEEATPLFVFGNSEAVGNTENFDYLVPFDVEEDVIYASAGSGYTIVLLDDESAAVAGYIDNLDDYSGYFGLPQEDLFQGSNELKAIDSVVNIDGDLITAPRFKRVYAGVKTSGGKTHSVFIDVNGNVYATGSNNDGQLCLGDLDDRDVPHQIDLGEASVSAAVGGDFTLILSASGVVYGCGSNKFGQLGLGTNLFVDRPDSGSGLSNVKSVSAGLDFSLLTTDDGLVVMGSNANEQFCTDEFNSVNEPYFLDAVDAADVRQFRAGRQSSYVLFRDGSVASCGLNDFGQLGIGNKNDLGPATVTIPENNFIKTVGVGPSAESAFFVALDGVVYGTGRNDQGQLGVGDRDDRDSPEEVLFEFDGDDVTRVSAASDHTLAW